MAAWRPSLSRGAFAAGVDGVAAGVTGVALAAGLETGDGDAAAGVDAGAAAGAAGVTGVVAISRKEYHGSRNKPVALSYAQG